MPTHLHKRTLKKEIWDFLSFVFIIEVNYVWNECPELMKSQWNSNIEWYLSCFKWVADWGLCFESNSEGSLIKMSRDIQNKGDRDGKAATTRVLDRQF